MPAVERAPAVYTALGVLAILFWSLTVGIARSMSEQLGAATTGALAMLGGGVLNGAWVVATGRWRSLRRTPGRYLVGCGALFASSMFCLYLAVGLAQTRREAIGASIINYLWPGLTMLLAVPLLGKRARLWLLPGAFLAFAGAALAGSEAEAFTWAAFLADLAAGSLPYLLALGAAVSWALYSNLSRRWGEGIETGPVCIFILFSGALLLGARFLLGEQSVWSGRVALELAFTMLVPVMLAYTFWDLAMRRGNIVLVAAISYGTPVLSVAFSCLYLGVRPGLSLVLACVLVVAGAVICKLSVLDAPATGGATPTTGTDGTTRRE